MEEEEEEEEEFIFYFESIRSTTNNISVCDAITSTMYTNYLATLN